MYYYVVVKYGDTSERRIILKFPTLNLYLHLIKKGFWGTGIGYSYGNEQDSPSAPFLWGCSFSAAYCAVLRLSFFPYGQRRPRASTVMQIMCRQSPLIFLIPNQYETKMYPPRQQ